MKSNREIREIRRNIRNMAFAGAGAIAMFSYAGYIYITNPGHVLNEREELYQDEILNIQEPVAVPALASDLRLIPESVQDARQETTETPSESRLPESKAKVALVEEIQSFEVSCNNGTLVFNWVTEGQGKYAYEIEKTTDNEHYEVFSRAPQPEKKDGLNHYFVEEAVDAGEVASYRLRRVIGKNKYEYTEPVEVKCLKKPAREIAVDVFPAGFGAFRIVVNSPVEEKFDVVLTDAGENILESRSYDAAKGSNEFVLQSEKIAKGSYHLRISNGSMTKEKKVVVK